MCDVRVIAITRILAVRTANALRRRRKKSNINVKISNQHIYSNIDMKVLKNEKGFSKTES
jgi:hypothetical protein